MIIERALTPFIVFADDPLLVGLGKINANKQRIVFVVDSHGVLQGSLSDGDFRRWIVANPTGSLDVSCADVANADVHSLPGSSPVADITPLMGQSGVHHVPLVDERGHLVALAIDSSDTLRIGQHEIGPGHPAFVIAEVGNNHNGSVDLAKKLVDLAVEAGADAVKFQLRDMDALYRQRGAATGGEDLGVQYTLDLLRRFSLPAEKLFDVFDHARDAGIDVMCTPWDAPSVAALADYGIPALKIASADLTNHELIADAAGRGLPLVLSTGMSRETEIIETVELLRSQGASFALLHCQSTYPAPYKDLNLAYLDRLSEIGQGVVGYSGHERGWHVPVAAVARGAHIIEKHFTVDRGMEGNDHTVSLLPVEFRSMVEQIRDVESSMGSGDARTVSTGEQMNRVTLAKSLVASRELKSGTVLSADDVDVKSPGRGLQPNALSELLGRTLHRDMAAGDFFFEGDLKQAATGPRAFAFDRPWGLPVRYHDWPAFVERTEPDFLEFHFSYRDLEIDIDEHFTEPLTMGFTTHLPDLFAGDFLVDLASADPEVWERSIQEVQRTIDVSRDLRRWFPTEDEPIVVVSMGGYDENRHFSADERPAMYARVAEALSRLDTTGVRIAAQTLPPYPWFMGGQRFASLFVNPEDTAEFARETGLKLCFDSSHTRLATNWLKTSFRDAAEMLLPHAIHLHLVDGVGVDGEGVQIGDGDINWPEFSDVINRAAPGAPFIPEIWQGHVNHGERFWVALDRLEPLLGEGGAR